MKTLLHAVAWTLALTTVGSAQEPKAAEVFVGGQDGYFAYRIPALLATPKGTLLAFCEGRKTSLSDDGNNDLVLRRSTDLGKTWQKLQVIYDEGGDAVISIGNPCPVLDADTGRIWLPMNRKNGSVLITYSDDDGVTWAPVKDITAQASLPKWKWYALGPGVGIQLAHGPHKGRLILPANHRETSDRSGPSASHIVYSDDHGKTWHVGGTVGLHTNECQLVETRVGERSELLINMRNHWARSGKKPELAGKRLVSTSSDGGTTWSEAIRHEQLTEPTCQASMIRYSWPGVKERSVILFANPDHASKRIRTTVRASFDEGKSWPVSRLIDAGPSGYTSLTRMPDGRIGLLYESDGYKKIKFVAFGLDSLGK